MSKPMVLVVEDDVHLLSGIREILELEDYDVMTAQNGLQGLDLMRVDEDNPPDVIVSDIMMPHMDGYDFLTEVRQEQKWVNIPFIFLTAKGAKTDVHKGSLLGADVYLKKPFDADDLLVAVKSRLARKVGRDEAQQATISNIKRQILITLNHELRTPLTLVVAYADLLKDFDPSNMNDTELVTFLQGVNSGATRLRRLIENFILLVEIDSGDAKKTYGWRKYNIQSMKDIAIDAARQVMGAETERCVMDIAENLPELTADREFVTVMLRELIDNAVKFSPENDTPITINIFSEGEQMVLQVTNEGRKIPQNEWENIWLPFYQIDRELYEDQGSGSGLTIIDGLVEIHGGSRDIVSNEETSTFTIRLPLTPPPEAPAKETVDEAETEAVV